MKWHKKCIELKKKSGIEDEENLTVGRNTLTAPSMGGLNTAN